jgi:hypothetical protein
MRLRHAVAIAASAVATMLVSAGPAQAALTVVNTNDSGAGSLRQTIAEAGPGETINVPAGDYPLTSTPLIIQKSLTLAGQGAGATVIRAAGPFRVIIAGLSEEVKIDLTLSGLTIRDGRVLESTAFGGGIIAGYTNLTLRQARVTGNLAGANGKLAAQKGGTALGGGVLLIDGNLTMVESEVDGNVAEAVGGPGAPGGTADGGGVALIGGAYAIEKSTISGNRVNAAGGQGAADAKQDGGNAVAGGLALDSPAAPSTVIASTITGNVAEALPGPGGDSAGFAGGAGYFGRTDTQPVTIANSTVAQNTADTGAVVASTASFGGGAVVIAEGNGTATITSSTFADNRLQANGPNSRGGNVLLLGSKPGSILVGNTIVVGGSGPSGSQNCGPTFEGASLPTSLGFNIDSLDQCGFKSPGDKVNTDPQLGPLQSNGGPTRTMAPALGSPAIDQGRAFGLTADQRGVLRPIDLPSIPNSAAAGADGSDIGAVEFQPSNAFTLGKLTRNKKKGTASLAVILSQPAAGTVTVTGKGLKGQTKTLTGQTEVKLKVVLASKKLRKKLRKKGKRKVGINVTYAPTGNTAVTQSRKGKLVMKKRKKKHPKPGNR